MHLLPYIFSYVFKNKIILLIIVVVIITEFSDCVLFDEIITITYLI